MQRRPGEVWFLSPQAHEGGDDKPRRHVLLTSCQEEESGVLAYASTKPTEAIFGAAFLAVEPAISPRAGFSRPTRIYPARLVLAASEDLLRMTGRLDLELPQLRSVLRHALGIGTGTVPSDGRSEQSSWRGKVVRLTSAAQGAIGYKFALVLTEHRYSSHRRYQLVVPVGNRAEMETLDDDLVATGQDWLRVLDMESTGAILAVAEVQSLFHRDEIEGWTGAVIDDQTLNELEAALERLFEL
jgi:hypothetical protein